MGRRFKRSIFILVAIACIAFIGMIAFSPYGKADGFEYKVIQVSQEINAPVDSIFSFLGKSSNAPKWSVFVSEIRPLNAEDFLDGSVGSRRRCYSSQNRNVQWDELITEVVPNEKRQLLIYNLKNFPLTADSLFTEQRYRRLPGERCRLTFTVFYKNGHPTWGEALKTYFAAYRIKSIFERNLRNIKHITEGNHIQKK